jgi:hypothetical protein
MRTVTAAFTIGVARVVCSVGTFGAAAHAQKPRERLYVAPVPTPTPYWDSYIVPRYRYRPEDDKVDPNGPPPSPVVRYGDQEESLRPGTRFP